MDIKKRAQAIEAETIAMRHELHEAPELSSQEFETVIYLQEQIKALGLPEEDVPDRTGVSPVLSKRRLEKTLANLADSDALPVQETDDNVAGPRQEKSKKDGVMHACGHDGHMAIILSTMKLLLEAKNDLSGKVYFLFEEGEEIGAGIDAMLAYLQEKQIDARSEEHTSELQSR